MPEHDNDRLEQFFQKATSKPDVPFNEEDWKKLEARLDAEQDLTAPPPRLTGKFIAASGLSVLLLISVAIWMIYEVQYGATQPPGQEERAWHASDNGEAQQQVNEGLNAQKSEASRSNQQRSSHEYSIAGSAGSANTYNGKNTKDAHSGRGDASKTSEPSIEKIVYGKSSASVGEATKSYNSYSLEAVPDDKLFQELIAIPMRGNVQHKQKAMVQLPGAEEEKTDEAEAVAGQQLAEDQKGHARPRLSLLLSFAPDFSSTSVARYSSPGKAYGAMVFYHPGRRWSIGAGAIRNNKQYTGSGEDYTPPSGYWKYYTNGKIPNSIDGACNVLEFPLMVQYMIKQDKRSRFTAGAGTSSYLMLNESYRYHFDEPNPGAKEGWSSRNSSRFMFNMVNFTICYERKIIPGLALGIEPYLKIPIEEIGWTNLKLFSSGASVNLRYTILGKKGVPPVTRRSRGPD